MVRRGRFVPGMDGEGGHAPPRSKGKDMYMGGVRGDETPVFEVEWACFGPGAREAGACCGVGTTHLGTNRIESASCCGQGEVGDRFRCGGDIMICVLPCVEYVNTAGGYGKEGL